MVGRTTFLPQDFWDDSEHGAAVQPESAVGYRVDVKRSEFHALTQAFSLELSAFSYDSFTELSETTHTS
jgi:hypothetical protein